MSKAKVDALMDEKNRLHEQIGSLVKANNERDLTAEEIENFNKACEDYEVIKSKADDEQAKLDRTHKLESMEAELKASIRQARPIMSIAGGGTAKEGQKSEEEQKTELYNKQKQGLELYLKGHIKPKEAAETYNLRVDNLAEGGYVMAPRQMATEILQELRNSSILMPLVRRLDALEVPGAYGQITATNIGSPTRVSEKQLAPNDTSAKFGDREMFTHPQSLSIKVTNQWLAGTFVNATAYINEQFNLSYGDRNDWEILLALGIKAPIGLLTGLSSSRHVTEGHTDATHPHVDNLLVLPDTVHETFLKNARYVMNRRMKTKFRLVKDDVKQYLWQPSLVAGTPDTFNGYPVITTENFPSATISGSMVALFGDLMEYFWLPCNQVEYLVNPYLYAQTRETEISEVRYSDGQPRRENAFAISKLP